MPICFQKGKIQENLYLVDTLQFGVSRITSSFIYWDGETCVLMDVGTSDNVANLFRVIKKLKIPLNHVKGMVLSHYHFDHGGGSLNFYRRMVKKNPDFKIMVPQDTHDKLQNAEQHLIAAETTFGDFIGSMRAVPEEAFDIVQKDVDLPIDFNDGSKLRLVSTSGHSLDHVSPSVIRNGEIKFTFLGEAAGTLFHGNKLVSLPTSMPNFRYDGYYKSFKKLQALNPECIGFCHFGAIIGRDDVQTFMNEHIEYMERFRNKIQKLYNENPSTRYILENTNEFWSERVDPWFSESKSSKAFFENLKLALTYGMMIDLGLRQVKYEKE
jgi:glyoxylase-like metal-dependent hydrolase (beta-lactamase superfamily II)